MDLFDQGRKKQVERESPLANRMRPRTLDEFVGQDHILGRGRLLRRAIEADRLSSVIFYGPPGTGKTTLAGIIANTTQSSFVTLNAVLDGVKQVRETIVGAREQRKFHGRRTTLFVDEVHRWNKAQQDALLPHVERGTLILIGATTENPYFEVNKALISRSRIFQLKPLNDDDLRRIAQQAISHPTRGYGHLNVDLTPNALDHLVNVANGDARGVLNALELAVETTLPDGAGVIRIDLGVAEESIQKRAVLYDKDGDAHYDTISAFIKSLRGSDADAALYWMAKMIYAGEDARFIFRRMAILASEDVGMADPQAVVVVQNCWSLYERIGLPEGQFALTQAALYLATAPKSNSALAYFDALKVVGAEREAEVPNALKDGNRDKEGFGHGQGYLYPHAYRDHWVAQQYLPSALQGKLFYQPSDQGYERAIQAQVARRREAQLAAAMETEATAPAILSANPAGKGRDAWLARISANAGANLGAVRDQIFEEAQVARHHVVLVLKADDGLLLWEALRRAPEGGVWGVVGEKASAILTKQSASLPEIERPSLILQNEGLPAELVFDRVVGRNLFSRRDGWAEVLAYVREGLGRDGSLHIAQLIPRYGQRLWRLISWPDEALQAEISAAEEKIWHDETDPLVNWDEHDLQAAFETAGLHVKNLKLSQLLNERLINEAQLARWLGEGGAYGRKLVENGVSAEALQQATRLFRTQLYNKSATMKTTVATIHVTKK